MFPYSDVSPEKVQQFADTVYKISRVEAVITHKKSKRTLEAITVSLRFLDQNEGLKFQYCTFCEAMGLAAEACCYASAFGFKSLVSIETHEEFSKLGYIYIKMANEEAAHTFSSSVSRFQERIPVDAEIVYFDVAHIGDLDEGLMIQSFLNTTRVLLVGSYCILITNSPTLKLEQWNAQDHLVIVLPTTVAKGHPDEGYMWVMRRIDRTDGEDVIPEKRGPMSSLARK